MWDVLSSVARVLSARSQFKKFTLKFPCCLHTLATLLDILQKTSLFSIIFSSTVFKGHYLWACWQFSMILGYNALSIFFLKHKVLRKWSAFFLNIKFEPAESADLQLLDHWESFLNLSYLSKTFNQLNFLLLDKDMPSSQILSYI